MRWRWTTPKTRGAAPRTRTPRARRSPRMEIAQVRDPAGWDPESPRQASGRPPSARRAAASCWASGAGREGRGGDWLPALRGTRTARGALPSSWRVPVDGAERSGAGRGPGLVRLAGGARFRSRSAPPLGPLGSASGSPERKMSRILSGRRWKCLLSPHRRLLILHLCSPSQRVWVVRTRGYSLLAGLEFINVSFQSACQSVLDSRPPSGADVGAGSSVSFL